MQVLGVMAAYVLLVNAYAFLLFAWDKKRAREGGWRIPERRLLKVALIGGSLGAMLGQRLLRHKTWKEPFRSRLRRIVLGQAGALALLTVMVLRSAPA